MNRWERKRMFAVRWHLVARETFQYRMGSRAERPAGWVVMWGMAAGVAGGTRDRVPFLAESVGSVGTVGTVAASVVVEEMMATGVALLNMDTLGFILFGKGSIFQQNITLLLLV